MKIEVIRKFKKSDYIIGDMMIDGQWFCNTLECPIGTATETVTRGSRKAVAPGTYKLKMTLNYNFRQKLPMLEDVPGRSRVFIHAGNTARDTTGCILPGLNKQVGHVLESRKTMSALLAKINAALAKGEELRITISN